MRRRWGLILITLIFPMLLLLWLQGVAAQGTVPAAILIEAVYYDGYALNDADEALALRNVGQQPLSLEGWAISDGGRSVPLADGLWLEPGALIWLTADATLFAQQFGFAATAEVTPWPGFANAGDEVLLLDAGNQVVDTLVYGDGDVSSIGWQGPALQPYTVRGVFGAEGQILARKRDERTALPLPDSDHAADWIQERANPYSGRRVRYPGWDMDTFFYPTAVTETATLTVAVAPDNALETLVAAIDEAQETIRIESLTFENTVVADALLTALARGVAVDVLLEGGPVGGVPAQEKWICQRLEAAGGACWFLISDATARLASRYRYLHAKFLLIDDHLAIVSSENLSLNSMPADDKRDGTWGRRGVLLHTDAPGVVAGLQRIFAADLDPDRHIDLQRWQADHPVYGRPPAVFIPLTESGGITYTVRYPEPAVFSGQFAYTLQQAPENMLREQDGLLALVDRAGRGDTILVQQLQERPFWGVDPQADPNVRLASFVAAARRGATVQFLLDSYFDDPQHPLSNTATCALLNEMARKEQLRLTCRLANPSGLGIHNKMVLLQVAGRGYVHAGSWNGSELSSKGNREVALLVQADAAYDYLAEMFTRDTPQLVYFPLLPSGFWGAADHLLISEVVYDPFGSDESEFIELVNPTAVAQDLSGFGLGDALLREDYEDLRRFPPGTRLEPGAVLVVTTSAVSYHAVYGRWPDFEILDSTTAVPDMVDDLDWGHTEVFLRLGNAGDEVILRDPLDRIVDAVAYGAGAIPGQVSCPLLVGTNHSLERYPYWQDSDDCSRDMRDWPFPSPGLRTG